MSGSFVSIAASGSRGVVSESGRVGSKQECQPAVCGCA